MSRGIWNSNFGNKCKCIHIYEGVEFKIEEQSHLATKVGMKIAVVISAKMHNFPRADIYGSLGVQSVQTMSVSALSAGGD